MKTLKQPSKSRKKNCLQCFALWQAKLEQNPDCWMVRFIPDDTLWYNAASREWVSASGPSEPWKKAVRLACHEDVHMIEDAHSLALKTMKTQEIKFRAKIQPDRPSRVWNYIAPWQSSKCNQRCGLLVILASPLPETVSFGL